MLRGIVKVGETFVLESFKGRWSDLPRKARKRGRKARNLGLIARDREGTTFDAVLHQVDSASVRAALAGLVTPGNHLIGDGGKAIAAFARRAGFRSTPGKPTPTRLTGTSITSRPTKAASTAPSEAVRTKS
jgi:hypothetical protein